jgi:hypothetical protein
VTVVALMAAHGVGYPAGCVEMLFLGALVAVNTSLMNPMAISRLIRDPYVSQPMGAVMYVGTFFSTASVFFSGPAETKASIHHRIAWGISAALIVFMLVAWAEHWVNSMDIPEQAGLTVGLLAALLPALTLAGGLVLRSGSRTASHALSLVCVYALVLQIFNTMEAHIFLLEPPAADLSERVSFMFGAVFAIAALLIQIVVMRQQTISSDTPLHLQQTATPAGSATEVSPLIA